MSWEDRRNRSGWSNSLVDEGRAFRWNVPGGGCTQSAFGKTINGSVTLEGNSAMKHLTMLAMAAIFLVGAVGCQTTQCNSCNNCGPTGGGLLGKLGARNCGGDCNVSTGCRACGLGWQHGGLDYSEGLATGNPCHMAPGRQSPHIAGPPTAGVAYPYYTVRGPRDFLIDNPPSIGR